MKKTYLILALAMMSATHAKSQDIHFSFAEYTPLLLNPAMAGANYEKEAILNYRNQWSNLGEPYKTTTGSFHARVSKKKRNANNTLAIGVNFMNDKAGDLGVVSNNFNLILADHVRISRESKIGVGMNIGFGQRSIKPADGRWATQYDGTNFNPSLGSGENLANNNFRYLDAGIGILYTYERKRSTLAKNMDQRINAGISAYHVNRPNNSFIEESSDRLPMRYTLFVNSEIALEGLNSSVMPSVTYHQQGNFNELLFGSFFKFRLMDETKYTGFNKPLSIALGLFGRLNDAAILKFTIDWDNYAFGYAYDINTSGLSSYTNGSGAHEICLRYSIPEVKPMRTRY